MPTHYNYVLHIYFYIFVLSKGMQSVSSEDSKLEFGENVVKKGL